MDQSESDSTNKIELSKEELNAIIHAFNSLPVVGVAAASEKGLEQSKWVLMPRGNRVFQQIYKLNYDVATPTWSENAKKLSATIKAFIGGTGLFDVSCEYKVVDPPILPPGTAQTWKEPDMLNKAVTLICLAGINHYVSNHTTTGPRLPRSIHNLLTQWCSFSNIEKSTEFFYECCHPVNKKYIAYLIIDKSIVVPDHIKDLSEIFDKIDRYIQLRTKGAPAGTRKLSLITAIARHIKTVGVMQFFPDIELLKSAIGAEVKARQLKCKAHLAHVYYGFTEEYPDLEQSQYDDAFFACAVFMTAYRPTHTLSMSPAVIAAKNAAPAMDPGWNAVIEYILAHRNDTRIMASEEKIEEAMSKVGFAKTNEEAVEQIYELLRAPARSSTHVSRSSSNSSSSGVNRNT